VILALVKSLVQKLNEPSVIGHQIMLGSRFPLCGCGPSKVHLAGPHQPAAVGQAEMGPESGATCVSCWPHFVDQFVCISAMPASRSKTNTLTHGLTSCKQPASSACFRKNQRHYHPTAGAYRITGHLAYRQHGYRGPSEPAGAQQRPHHAGGGRPARPPSALRCLGPRHRHGHPRWAAGAGHLCCAG
jgi:hypothetical protein